MSQGLSPYETAVCELATGDADAATQRLQAELERDPANPDLLVALGCAKERKGEIPEATKLYRAALVASSSHGLANLNLGYLILIRGNTNGALACLQRALDAPPRPSPAELAVPTFDAAALPLPAGGEAEVRASMACLMLGLKLQENGRFEDSAACFEHALRLYAGNGGAYYALATAGRSGSALVLRMESALQNRGLRPSERGPLCFALGRGLADLGEFDRAMALYDEGNQIALSEASSPVDREGFARTIDWMIENYTAERVRRHARQGSDSDLPLLIVGMMRSGTTLVEQIASSHPDVVAGDELVYWRDGLSQFMRPGSPPPNAGQSESLTAGYLGLLRTIGPDALRVTDKMPQNFVALGLIHSLFPNARIVCCRRNAAENCLSIYTTSFRNSMPFANRREDIAFFYRQFERLMAHWSGVIPRDRLMEVAYEDLLTDREATTRRLIAFCGLDWHDDCLRPEQNRRPVKTASVWQVRQPIQAKSRQGFEPWLEQFRRLLA